MKFSTLFRTSEVLRPSFLLLVATIILFVSSSYFLSFKGMLVISLSILFFFIGEKIGYSTFKPQLTVSSKRLYYVGVILFIVSLISLYLDFYSAGGIPLFNSVLRRFMSPLLTSLAFLMVPATGFLIASKAQSKYARLITFVLVFFTAGMMALLGFRTEVLAAILVSLFTAYYTKIIDLKEIIFLGILALCIGLGITIIREGGLGFLLFRTTSTLAAFDFAILFTGPFGLTHGFVQFVDIAKLFGLFPVLGGRNLITLIIGGRLSVSTTTTLFGPPFIDFGWLGLLVFLFFGLVLGAGYKAARTHSGVYAPLYALVLTFLLLGVETGITDGIVWLYFLSASLFFLFAHTYEFKT